MGTGYWNHMELAPACTSGVHQYENPEHFTSDKIFLSHIGPMHYGGVGHGHSPTQYEPLLVFPQPGGTNKYQSDTYGATRYAANVMPHGPQFYCIQQPLFYRNFVRFDYNMPLAYYSREKSELLANNFSCNEIQEAILHHPELVDGSLLEPGFLGNKYTAHQSNDKGDLLTPIHNFYSSPPNANFMSLGHSMADGYSSPGYNTDCWTWSDIDDGITYATPFRVSPSRFNVSPGLKGCLQHYIRSQADRIVDEGGELDSTYADEDPYRRFHSSVANSKPFSWSQAALPNKNEIRMSTMLSSYNSGLKICNERRSSQQQHGHKNAVRTFMSKTSPVSPVVGASGRINRKKQSGWSPQSSKDPALAAKISGMQNAFAPKDCTPPLKRNEIQKTTAPCQIWRVKGKTQPSASQSKPSSNCTKKYSKRTKKYLTCTASIHHITWDGFDEPCEPIGQNCHICDEDLSYVPRDDKFEYYDALEHSNLPGVSVLPCGYSFHNECLQLITPEEQSTDPLCYICFGCMR